MRKSDLTEEQRTEIRRRAMQRADNEFKVILAEAPGGTRTEKLETLWAWLATRMEEMDDEQDDFEELSFHLSLYLLVRREQGGGDELSEIFRMFSEADGRPSS